MGSFFAKRRWLIFKLLLVALVIGGIVYQTQFRPIAVVEHQVKKGSLAREVMGTGTLEARVKISISPKISGRIDTLLFDQGDRITKGDLLVQLDNEELTQQVAIAQANLEVAKATVNRTQVDKTRTAAILDKAQKHYKRSKVLFEKDVVNQEEIEKAQEQLTIAEAGLAGTRAAISEAQKSRIAAEKTLEYHRARLKDTKIVAPFDGLIVQREREAGDIVVPGTSILTLISMDELWIQAWVDETEMMHLEKSQPARVVFRSMTSQSFQGKVARIGKQTDRETREFLIDVHVPELPLNWAVGQRAEVYIETTKKKNVLVLPERFLVRKDSALGVFINQNNRATWRSIESGVEGQESIEVVKGLEAGNQIVMPTMPNVQLKNGKRIAVQ